MRFEWDEEKAEENRRKHRVPFEPAQETRYVMIGMSSMGLLYVSFTYREDAIRFISARRAAKWMVKIYEDQK